MAEYSKLTKEQEEIFKDPRMSNKKIAEKLGISLSSAINRRSRLGLDRYKVLQAHGKEIGQAFKDGETVAQLMDYYDASSQMITRVLYSEGLVFKKHRNGSKGVIKEVYTFPKDHWEPYNLYLEKEIRESAKFYGVPVETYKKWIKKTPEGQAYFARMQGRENEPDAKRLHSVFERVRKVLQTM